MKISILQPEIIRGNIEHNQEIIQKLIEKSNGDLLILPEYTLTGSLVLDANANISDWVLKSKKAKLSLKLSEEKKLIINSLVESKGQIFNCCELLPSDEKQYKLFPDKTELEAGINPGEKQVIFRLNNKKFKIIICTDLRHIEEIPTDNLDFIIFIFHFTKNNFEKVIQEVKNISLERKIQVIISSLVSDKNIGFSSYVNNNTVVALPNCEGILEIEL